MVKFNQKWLSLIEKDDLYQKVDFFDPFRTNFD